MRKLLIVILAFGLLLCVIPGKETISKPATDDKEESASRRKPIDKKTLKIIDSLLKKAEGYCEALKNGDIKKMAKYVAADYRKDFFKAIDEKVYADIVSASVKKISVDDSVKNADVYISIIRTGRDSEDIMIVFWSLIGTQWYVVPENKTEDEVEDVPSK